MALTIFMALLGTPSGIIFGNSILIRQNQRPTMPKCKAPVLNCYGQCPSGSERRITTDPFVFEGEIRSAKAYTSLNIRWR